MKILWIRCVKNKYISYGSCGIPYYVSDEVKNLENLITLTPEKVEKKRKIPVHLMNEVTNVNFNSKTLTIWNKSKKSEFNRSYDSLVIATGAHATSSFEVSLEHERIFYVHNLSHAERLRAFLKSPDQRIQSVTIIGAGYIADYHARGLLGNSQTEIKVVCGLEDEINKKFALKYKIPETTTDVTTLFDRSDIDAVVLSTPNKFHAPYATDFLKNKKA